MELSVDKYISNEFGLIIPEHAGREQLEMILSEKINELIEKDFPQLINILYRIDISEQKLKTLLKQHQDVDAARIMSAMIIDRQLEKIKLREQFRKNEDDISADERW